MHSIRTRPDIFLAYRQVLADPKFSGGLLYSFVVGVITIIVSLLIIVPTAYWVRLQVPRLRPVVEFVTLMPFVIPPVILVFGLIRIYSARPLQLTAIELRQRPAARRRLRGPVVPVHVPGRRHGPRARSTSGRSPRPPRAWARAGPGSCGG